MSEESKSSFDEALKLLTSGEVPINEKTGKPSIKDIMDHCKISRSYAYKVRRRYLREKTAREEGVALPSKIEITRKAPPKPPPPRPEPPEPEVEKPSEATWEEVMEELESFRDMLRSGYRLTFAKDGIVPTIMGSNEYARPEAKCDRLADNVISCLKRRIDPETLEGYDLIMLAINHGLFILPIGFKWWKTEQAKKEKEEE